MDSILNFFAAENAVLAAAGKAAIIMADPLRLGVIALAVIIGLVVGILPGIGGVAGMSILLPFTFAMDPYTGLAFLLGLASVTATGDPIPAILFGVTGGAGSAATVVGGLPLGWVGGDGARRLAARKEGRGRSRFGGRLHVLRAGRDFRRGAAGPHDSHPAPGLAVRRLARAARPVGVRLVDGGRAVGQCAVARHSR